MDAYTAALLGALLLLGFFIAMRLLGVWQKAQEDQVEILRLKHERMARLDGFNPKKNGKTAKKPKKDEEDEDVDEDDPLVRVLDHPVVRGMAQRFGVDVDLVLDGDERELAKVEKLLSVAGKQQGAAPGAVDDGLLG